MRTIEFAAAMDSLLENLRFADIARLLEASALNPSNLALTSEQKAVFSALIFDLQTAYSVANEDPEKVAIISALGLDPIFLPQTLGALITQFNNATASSQLSNDRGFLRLYFMLRSALALQAGVKKLLVNPKLEGIPKGDATLDVEIFDYEGTGIELARLVEVVGSVEKLFLAVSEAVTGHRQLAKVKYVDSGTPIIISLQGVEGVINAIRKSFKEIWQLVRDHKNIKLDKNLGSIKEGLSLISDIRSRVANKDLDPETGHRLEHAISSQMTRLIGVGVMVTETEAVQMYDRKAVMTAIRDLRLLGNESEKSE
jgi:hypothetical protein